MESGEKRLNKGFLLSREMRQTDNTIFHRRAKETYSRLKNYTSSTSVSYNIDGNKAFWPLQGSSIQKKECTQIAQIM